MWGRILVVEMRPLFSRGRMGLIVFVWLIRGILVLVLRRCLVWVGIEGNLGGVW
jgi:hypothetical protein